MTCSFVVHLFLLVAAIFSFSVVCFSTSFMIHEIPFARLLRGLTYSVLSVFLCIVRIAEEYTIKNQRVSIETGRYRESDYKNMSLMSSNMTSEGI